MLDLITVKFLLSYSTRSLQFFGIPDVAADIIGIFIGVHLSTMWLVLGERLANRPLLLLAVLLVFLGLQFITLGWLGEIIVRTHYGAQGEPVYAVREIVGSDHSKAIASL